jgi:hypothetical protein
MTRKGSLSPAPNVASTFPARSIRAFQWSDSSCERNHSARCCSKNVGAGIRQSCSCWSLIQARSRCNQRYASDRGLCSANSPMRRLSAEVRMACGSALGSVAKKSPSIYEFTLRANPKCALPVLRSPHSDASQCVAAGGFSPLWNRFARSSISRSARVMRSCCRKCSAQFSTRKLSTCLLGAAAS